MRTIHSGSFNTVFAEAELMVLKVVETRLKGFTTEGGSYSLDITEYIWLEGFRAALTNLQQSVRLWRLIYAQNCSINIIFLYLKFICIAAGWKGVERKRNCLLSCFYFDWTNFEQLLQYNLNLTQCSSDNYLAPVMTQYFIFYWLFKLKMNENSVALGKKVYFKLTILLKSISVFVLTFCFTVTHPF